MELLGKLGIDWKLLIAQIINFGLLLWLLTKFLYRPIVKRIEKDEADLKLIQTKRAELKREESKVKQEIAAAKKRSKAIIREAENIAAGIKKRTQEEIDKEKKAVIDQIHAQAKAQERSRQTKNFRLAREKIVGDLKMSLAAGLDDDVKKELQAAFFASLINKVTAFPSSLSAASNPAVTLEAAFPLSREQREALAKLVKERIGEEITLSEKQNKDLISGLRLEIGGTVIESNLAAEISRAAESDERA
jgi:F-type H+-transporting ATPase subunit b